MDTLVNLEKLQEVLVELAEEFRTQYQFNLIGSDRFTRERSLVDSITSEVRIDENKSFLVTLTLNDYWKYVEYGTKPHFPPVSAILKWIQIKPVIPRPFDNGRIPTQQQLAFLISRKIAKVGTKGSYDLQDTKDEIFPKYRERISEALGHDMENYIRKVITNK